MSKWEHIIDTNPIVTPVWFYKHRSRSDDDSAQETAKNNQSKSLDATENVDLWCPLRKCDCKALNKNDKAIKSSDEIVIENGRSTAILSTRTIDNNFYVHDQKRDLMRSTWFALQPTKDKNVPDKMKKLPISKDDCAILEAFYQMLVRELMSLRDFSFEGNNDKVLKSEIVLSDKAYKATVFYDEKKKSLSIRRRKTNILLSTFDSTTNLQRGYGQYSVSGEEEEMSLGPVNQCIFVVHGIGEAMWTKDNSMMNSIVHEMDTFRTNIYKRLHVSWKRKCAAAKKEGKIDMPPPPSRIEVMPIRWYERIHGPNSLMKSLSSVTIDSIQSLRAIANDVVFDVLMYLTPEFCYETLDCVLGQINDIYTKFISINNGYVRNGGQFGLIGHSLGSVISWDMLSIHKQWKHDGIIDLTEVDDSQSLRKQPQVVSSPLRGTDSREEKNGLSKQAKANDGHTDKDRTFGPNLSRKMKKTLPFEPSFTCFLGSPLGQFLSLRGAHTLFEQMRTVHTEQELTNGLKRSLKQSTSPFTLPTKAVYNIFHPSDPVAYRIEPLLMSPDVEKHDLPKPLMIEPGGEYCVNESFRPEVFAQKVRGYLSQEPSTWISDTLKITPPQPSSWMSGTLKMNPPSFVKQLSMAYSSSLDTSDKAIESAEKKIEVIDEKIPPKFALSGTSDRLDFQLHTGLIQNEYVSSVSAHSSYFTNSDVIDFIVGIAVVKSANHQ